MPIYEYRHPDGQTRDEFFPVGKAPVTITHAGRVYARVRIPRTIHTIARSGYTEDTAVAQDLARGYAHLERRGNLKRKGTQPTTKQIRHALSI